MVRFVRAVTRRLGVSAVAADGTEGHRREHSRHPFLKVLLKVPARRREHSRHPFLKVLLKVPARLLKITETPNYLEMRLSSRLQPTLVTGSQMFHVDPRALGISAGDNKDQHKISAAAGHITTRGTTTINRRLDKIDLVLFHNLEMCVSSLL